MMLDEFLARPQMLGFDTFPVVDRGGAVEGLVDLRRLLDVPPQDRATTSLRSIAVPVAKVARATPDEPVTSLWDRIGSDANSPVLVMLDGRPAGILSPHDISRALYSAHRQQGRSRPA
jgi:CBS domain-containing protein